MSKKLFSLGLLVGFALIATQVRAEGEAASVTPPAEPKKEAQITPIADAPKTDAAPVAEPKKEEPKSTETPKVCCQGTPKQTDTKVEAPAAKTAEAGYYTRFVKDPVKGVYNYAIHNPYVTLPTGAAVILAALYNYNEDFRNWVRETLGLEEGCGCQA